MRVLHTSDWHLGRSFHRVGLLDAQAAFVDHLLSTAVSERVDLVVVSGDIYDRALPAVDAVQLASSSLRRLVEVGVRVVMTSGNHDSAPRLGFAASLIDAAGIHLRTDQAEVGRPVVISDAYGDVAIYAIPYLEPDLVSPGWALTTRSHQVVLDEAMARVRADLRCRGEDTRSLVLAHAFVAGGRASESERDISVGGVQCVAVETFAGVDYAALGHLHGRQTLAPSVRYCGSPLAYSFSETDHVKGSWLVELGPAGLERVDFVPAPVPRRLARIRGRLESLLRDPALADAEQAWVQVRLTDPQRPKRAMERIQQRFPHALALAYERRCQPRRRSADVGSARCRHRRGLLHGGRGPLDRGFRGRPPFTRFRCVPGGGGRQVMRVHRLEVTAFGPFAATEVIDFEPLNAAGVFLLTGHTGAGKTSILDAICFALYGQVPGDRDRAKAYRSDHAAPGVPPRVVLDVTLQGRRFRFTRQAPWARRSKRARSGYVDERARATAEELVGGAWTARSSRVDEVGHLISRLLGLNREQFCQVVLLPQGDFQAFLRAGAADRRRILESLFATQRFQAVERWLVDHRRLQARRCRDQEETLSRLIARLHEVCGQLLPEDPVGVVRDFEQLVTDLSQLIVSGRSAVAEAEAFSSSAETAAKQARHALDEARALADRQARHQEARQRQAMLRATRDIVAARGAAVRRAHAAAPLLPLVELAAEAVAEADRAARELRTAVTACSQLGDLIGPFGEPLTVDAIEAAGFTLADRRTRLEALGDVERQCDLLTERLAGLSIERARLAALVAALEAEIAEDPGEVAAARSRLAAAERTAADGEPAQVLLDKGERVLLAAREVRRHDDALSALGEHRLEAREAAVGATQRWLEARERYLAGVAADLAATLTAGEPCPVCGSQVHPNPASPTPQHVTRQREDDLLAAATATRAAVDRLDEQIAHTEKARAAADNVAGGLDVTEAEVALAAAKQACDAATQAVTDRGIWASALADLVAAAEGRRAAREAARAELATVTERAAECARRLSIEQARIAAEVGSDVRVAKALAAVADQVGACRALTLAVRGDQLARIAAKQARDRLHVVLSRSEFETETDAVSASMAALEMANAEALVRSHAAELAAVEHALADAALLAASAEQTPDLERLEQASDRAAETAARAVAEATDHERRQQRLEELAVDYQAGVAELRPRRHASRLADDVAGLCTGTSVDNSTRTALSHYVLSARLSQVVDAANTRLGSICGGRYRLVHSPSLAGCERKGGLGLSVSDLHTDRLRDPATLSGGETFYVSLSLALGLADVVAHEAGGAELSTLFVDEGFGSLDDETRDEVLDELDSLRSGGRTVGLVSHLAELRARFPSQVHIIATPSGSKCLSTVVHNAE